MILYHTDLRFDIRGVDTAQPTQIRPNAVLNEREPHSESKTYHQEPASPSGCSTAIRTILRLPKAFSLSSQHLTMPP